MISKNNHYCFAADKSIITDHKLLVAILKKDKNDPIREYPVHLSEKTSIQGLDNIQARARIFYCRLAILTQPKGKKG